MLATPNSEGGNPELVQIMAYCLTQIFIISGGDLISWVYTVLGH